MTTIVVVEDDAIYRTVLQTALKGAGHDARMAGSVQEMTKILAACLRPPALIILDWYLPDAAGRVVAWLRAVGYTMPIVIITASDKLDKVWAEALNDGATLVVNKVESLDRLLAVVEQVMASQTTSSSAPISPRQLLWLDTQHNTVIRLEPPYPKTALTPAQTNILRILLESPEAVPTTILASRVIRYEPRGIGSRTELVVKRMYYLRRRLASLGVEVRGRRGKGYTMRLGPIPGQPE